MEVGEHIVTLDVLAAKLDVAVSVVLVVLQVCQAELEDPALEALGRDLRTGGTSDQGLARLADREDARRLDVVPLFPEERV